MPALCMWLLNTIKLCDAATGLLLSHQQQTAGKGDRLLNGVISAAMRCFSSTAAPDTIVCMHDMHRDS